MRAEQLGKPIDITSIDGLRSESQSVHPSVYQQFRTSGSEAKDALEQMYGIYMHPRVLSNNQNVTERFIILDDVYDVYQRWQVKPQLGMKARRFSMGYDGFSLQSNGIIYFRNPHVVWNRHREELIQDYRQKRRGLKDVRKAFLKDFADQLTAHEVFHQYQDPSLEEAFSEIAGSYYQQEIGRALGRREVVSLPYPEVVDAYASLLVEYGDDVHKLNFGTLKSPTKRERILAHSRYEWDCLIRDGIIWDDSYDAAK